MLAPTAEATGGFDWSVIEIVVLVIGVLAVLAILGWRSPDRSPGADTKAQRDRIED